MISGFGPTELIIVLVIVLLIFGPKRLPGLGRQLGSGMREFKDSIAGKDGDDRDEDDDDGRREVSAALGRPQEDAAAPADTATATPAEPARERTHQP